jgi:hypothetical protein
MCVVERADLIMIVGQRLLDQRRRYDIKVRTANAVTLGRIAKEYIIGRSERQRVFA